MAYCRRSFFYSFSPNAGDSHTQCEFHHTEGEKSIMYDDVARFYLYGKKKCYLCCDDIKT